MAISWKKIHFGIILLIFLGLFLFFFSCRILTGLGEYLVLEEKPVHSQAAVVLNTGVEIYPRLMEAAALYREGVVDRVAINGDRKSEILRSLEKMGFETCCPWHEDSIRILSLLGVPRDKILPIAAEDAYDTFSEADAVGRVLLREEIRRVVVVTSKSHTRRAAGIWRRMYAKRLEIHVTPARDDPYDPKGWWKEGRQIRWVMAEYGAWIYLVWKNGWNIR